MHLFFRAECGIRPLAAACMVSQLTELEEESIEYFVSFVQVLGMPKSIGQIYGLMFVSTDPMAMDHVIDRLDMSKGSVSQGLSTLKALGAIISEPVDGDRREHYVADLNVSRIVNHFFEERLEPRLNNGEQRLERMKSIATIGGEELEEENAVLSRLQALEKWQNRGKRAIPMLRKLLKS